jgi:hypothetical protein
MAAQTFQIFFWYKVLAKRFDIVSVNFLICMRPKLFNNSVTEIEIPCNRFFRGWRLKIVFSTFHLNRLNKYIKIKEKIKSYFLLDGRDKK